MTDEAKYEQYQRELLAFGHFVTTPFRWIMGFLTAVLIIALFLAWGAAVIFTDNVGWIIDRGGLSERARLYTVETARGVPAEAYRTQGQIFAVDFGSREFQEDRNFIYGFTSPCGPTGTYQPDFATLPKWTLRRETIFWRKSDRMRHAYVTGAISVAVLRSTLTSIKLGLDPDVILADAPTSTSVCLARPVSLDNADTQERWDRVSRSIQMPGAPTVTFRWAPILVVPPSDPAMSSNHLPFESPQSVTGMYIGEKPTGEFNMYSPYPASLGYFVTGYDDIFSKVPPLARDQVQAVEALNDLSTDAYWLKVAHANRVNNDAKVLEMAERTRAFIQAQFQVVYGSDEYKTLESMVQSRLSQIEQQEMKAQ